MKQSPAQNHSTNMEKEQKKPHCLVLPFPAQGHINPLLQFSKRLRHKGITATLLTTHYLLKTTFKSSSSLSSLSIESISDGHDEGGIYSADSYKSYFDKFRQCGSKSLMLLLETGRFDVVIYDPHLSWALDVAKEMGVLGVAFFTQPLAVDSIYYHVQRGLLKLPIEHNWAEGKVVVPGVTPLDPLDLPSFVYKPNSYPDLLDYVLNQFCNIDDADWVLCNTFYKLEQEVVDVLAKLWPLGTVGPTVPSMYLDKQIKDDYNYGLNLINPINDVCMEWLNSEARSKGSVVYVSFGSVADIGVEQMEELAWGLKSSNCNFLWVVRSHEQIKLPENFSDETSEKGLIVSWCPQLEVLAHKSIGCFLTHCGWNSTLEALSLGVPLIAMPQWTDQNTCAKYVADVWGTGLKARRDKGDLVRRDEIDYCIKELIEGEKRTEIKRNVEKWRALAKEAMDEGGSSDESINKFIEFISSANSRSSRTSAASQHANLPLCEQVEFVCEM